MTKASDFENEAPFHAADPIKPATDEEIEAARDFAATQQQFPFHILLARLIARLDAEKARAEKAEAQNARMREVILRNGGFLNGFCVGCGLGGAVPEVHFADCIIVELRREKSDK